MVTTEFAAGQTAQQVGEKERLARFSWRSFYHWRDHPSIPFFFPPHAPPAATRLPRLSRNSLILRNGTIPRQAITTERCVPGLELIFRISR
jgi:hypothetical protein